MGYHDARIVCGGQPVVGPSSGRRRPNLTGLHCLSFDPPLGDRMADKKKNKKDKKGK